MTVWCKNIENIHAEQRISFQSQKPASVMVLASVTSCGQKTPLVFIEQGVKVNLHVYILGDVDGYSGSMGDKTFGDSGVTLQQNGATSHTTKLVHSFCKDNFKGFLSKELWPPSSPDLNPMEFGVGSILEQKACIISHRNINSLKRSVVKCCDKIDSATLCPICSQIITRL
ncbi:hypothetical protein FHG87_011483 [Trinorchestia longiramus]|nr:hypothetical protein FHG87_011483 [Trinorchestia longiramus]